ncbi:MAG TPA: hypothetical protein VJP02_28480 [Candidatus Sulfotelmatobacter sp.]|nr:hypothetical protein [Candidatus Sulfotelmatobacter sp.]
MIEVGSEVRMKKKHRVQSDYEEAIGKVISMRREGNLLVRFDDQPMGTQEVREDEVEPRQ